MEVMDQKRKLLKEANDKQWLHMFEHELEHPVCRLSPTADAPNTYTVEAF